MDTSRAVGLLLAGGQGRRLGLPVPKAFAQVGGRTLLERSLEILRQVCVDVRVVVPPTLRLQVRGGIRRIYDPGRGPLEALAAGLADTAGRPALALGVDFPLVRPELLSLLLGRLHTNVLAVVPRPGRILQPLVAAYSPDAAPVLRQAIAAGEHSLLRVLKAQGNRVLRLERSEDLPGGWKSLFNLNWPMDLKRAERMLEARVAEACEV